MPDHMQDENFHVFTTFRLDGNLLSDAAHTTLCDGHKSDVYLLPYHFDRLKTAAATMNGFRVPEAMISLEAFEQEIHRAVEHSRSEESKEAGVRRGKVSWWPSGRLEITTLPVPRSFPNLLPTCLDELPDPLWTVVLDDRPTNADVYTEIKTSYRTAYNRARQSAGIDLKSNKEVLLYNDNGEVMDGSITTAYFYRDNRWVTPESGSLKGITRRFALETGLCSISKTAVTSDSLSDGETIWLSNAFRGFFTATFHKR